MEKKQKIDNTLPAFFRKGKRSAPEIKTKSKAIIGRSLVKKILLILLSLFVAMLLWGYVLLAQNPDRTKQYTGVEVKLESGSEADLLYKNLMVYGGISSYLDDIAVTVTAPLADITKITSKDITASVNFNDVHSAGTARLEIKAVCSSGTVVDIEPAYIEVEIDDIITRVLSVDQEFVGELQPGYWHDAASVSPKTLTVKGARRDIEKISRAICEIELPELTESINRSVALLITDDEGNVFDQSKLIDSVPAVNVQMDVYPYKNVDIIYSIADELPDGLEIVEEYLNVSSVNIACEASLLAKLPSIAAETVHVGGITQPGVYEFTLGLSGFPDNAVLIDNPNLKSVKLTLVVAETVVTRTFDNIPITIAGKQNGLIYAYYLYDENGELGSELLRLVVPVSITGVGSAAEQLAASAFVLMLDLTGYGAGEYDLPLRLIWNQQFTSLVSVDYPEYIHVVITLPEL